MTTDNETKQRILETALAEFAEHGFDGTSTAGIARTADVNKALIFYYFGSKKGLYRAAFRKLRDMFLQRLDEATTHDVTQTGRIEAFIRIHIDLLRGNPQMASLLIRELIAAQSGAGMLVDDLLDMFKVVLKRLGGAIREGISTGELRDVDPIQTLISIVSLDVFFFLQKSLLVLMGFDKLHQASAVESSREDHVVDLVLNGIRNREDTL